MMIAVLGVFVISVSRVALDHIETRYAQPDDHIDAGNTYQDVQKSLNPTHTHGNPGNTVETKDTNSKPVKRANYGQNERNN